MKELCEITWINEEGEEPVTVKEKYYLLHFGLRHEIIDLGNGSYTGVNDTVCICQSVKTGQLEYFDANQIRILGDIIKK